MTKIPRMNLIYENDLYLTVVSMIAQLLRRDSNFNIEREFEDKIHVCCRETSILLIAILKTKNILVGARCGFTYAVSEMERARDYWIVEYYNEFV